MILEGILKPGDIFVTSVDQTSWISRLVAWSTGSSWTHAFMVTDDDTLLESQFPDGVKERTLLERFMELQERHQDVQVLRAPELSDEQRQAVVAAGTRMVGRRYDFVQAVLFGLFRMFVDDGPKRLICSRLITEAYSEAGVDLFPPYVLASKAGTDFKRSGQLRKGWAIPEDLHDYSILEDVTDACIAIARDQASTYENMVA